jgi:glycosyltransferase involved in cell wall biosynthesis
MAVGLPMIVTNIGGNAEAVVGGETGWVIPTLDAPALARAVQAAYGDRTSLDTMGRAARRRVEERFSLERMCADHASLYLALCKPAEKHGRTRSLDKALWDETT